MAFSLTQALLASSPDAFSKATHSLFLSRAALGQVPRSVLGTWLANDRLYIHGYVRAIGHQLSLLTLPATVAAPPSPPTSSPNERLLKWMIDALVNIHREEIFFIDTARRYRLEINLPTDDAGKVLQSAKLEGLVRFEALFDGLAQVRRAEDQLDERGRGLPWLEFAVVLWGTEKCYLEAWRGVARAQEKAQQAQQQQQQQQQQQDEEQRVGKEKGDEASEAAGDSSRDLDGGALRQAFIPNWTSAEFVEFVDRLGDILDDAVREQLRWGGEAERHGLMERAMAKWAELLDAERTFWPCMA